MVPLRRKSIALSIVLIMGLLGYAANKKHPIPTGDAEDYWEFSCGIELSVFDGYFPYAHWRGVFPKTDGWYVYYYQEHHGRHVFRVSKESLIEQISEVYSLLSSEIKNTGQESSEDKELQEKNSRRKECVNIRNSAHDNYELFLDEVSSVRSSASNLRYGQDEIESFKAQWKRSQIYWAAILFEAAFLCFWWVFAFHKGACGKLNRRVDLRLALSPILLFVPHYLGYAPYLLSSGPSGGILYPFFATLMALPFVWIPFNPVEIWLLKGLPQPLAYISPVPASPMAMSVLGAVSPTVLVGFAILVLMIGSILRKYRKSIDS